MVIHFRSTLRDHRCERCGVSLRRRHHFARLDHQSPGRHFVVLARLCVACVQPEDCCCEGARRELAGHGIKSIHRTETTRIALLLALLMIPAPRAEALTQADLERTISEALSSCTRGRCVAKLACETYSLSTGIVLSAQDLDLAGCASEGARRTVLSVTATAATPTWKAIQLAKTAARIRIHDLAIDMADSCSSGCTGLWVGVWNEAPEVELERLSIVLRRTRVNERGMSGIQLYEGTAGFRLADSVVQSALTGIDVFGGERITIERSRFSTGPNPGFRQLISQRSGRAVVIRENVFSSAPIATGMAVTLYQSTGSGTDVKPGTGTIVESNVFTDLAGTDATGVAFYGHNYGRVTGNLFIAMDDYAEGIRFRKSSIAPGSNRANVISHNVFRDFHGLYSGGCPVEIGQNAIADTNEANLITSNSCDVHDELLKEQVWPTHGIRDGCVCDYQPNASPPNKVVGNQWH